MANNPFNRDRFRRPEVIFQEILRKGAQGAYREKDENIPVLYRATVLAVDTEGGLLENPDANGSVEHTIGNKKLSVKAKIGPKNPPNSIKARIITDGLDKFLNDENLRVFWPFFPDNISVPVKPGEHVYVIFEDTHQQHGLWISKVAGHVGINYAPGQEFYGSDSSLSQKFDDTKGVSSDEKKYNKDEDAAETKPGNRLSTLLKKK